MAAKFNGGEFTGGLWSESRIVITILANVNAASVAASFYILNAAALFDAPPMIRVFIIGKLIAPLATPGAKHFGG